MTTEQFNDPVWRLTSGELYQIAPADGSGVQPFKPRPEQTAIIEAIYNHGARQILIPKARRLGMSTTLGLIAADSLVFRKSWQGSLVDATAADASRKLGSIVKVALENLPKSIRSRCKFPKSNDSLVTCDVLGSGESNFYAGMNARGGSNDFLWISEWGVIQFEDPKRSGKIRSGALPSARHGITVVETTWAGGKGGDVWELLEPSMTGKANDWRILFFPWWVDPRNVDPLAMMDKDAEDYFVKIQPRLDREGITLSDGQRRWWAKERRAQGIYMARENPTFLDECWTVPVQGAVFAAAVERARTEGRIASFPVAGDALVNTVWDLGNPHNTVVWYFQVVGREIRFIDCDIGSVGPEGTLTERVAFMLGKGYSYGKHYLPHDAQTTERSGLTFLTELAKAGLPSQSLAVVPRVVDVWIGINHTLELFPALSFRSPQTDKGVEGLVAYRTRKQGEGVNTIDEPINDWAAHRTDPVRYVAEAHRAGLIAFKHTTAEVRKDWYSPGRRERRGAAPMRVSHNF